MNTTARVRGQVLAACFAASVALLAAGCGTASAPTSGGKTTVTITSAPPTSAPATSPSPSGPGQCSTSDLKVAVGGGNGAAGSTYYPLNFTNISSAACTLYGYPGVSFVTDSGSQIGAPANRGGTTARATITVQPGAVAHATLQVTDAGNYPAKRCGQIVNVTFLKVYPPNQYSAVTIAIRTQACSSKSLVTMLVSTISSGA